MGGTGFDAGGILCVVLKFQFRGSQKRTLQQQDK